MTDFTQDEVTEILGDFDAAGIKPDVSQLLPKDGLMGTGGYVAIKAAERGHVSTLKYLHQHGVDLSAEVIGNGIPGWRPAEVAAANNHESAIEFYYNSGIYLGTDNATRGPAGYANINKHYALAEKINHLVEQQHEQGLSPQRPRLAVPLAECGP